MTRAFNIEGLVRLQNYMGGKTLSDARFFAVLNADVVEMIDGEESTTKRRYFRIAENDESITFSCILGSSQQQMVVTKATKQLDVTTTEIGGGIPLGPITTEMLADGAVTSEKLAAGLDVSGLFFILPKGTSYPYTLTEADKTRLTNAKFILASNTSGQYAVLCNRIGNHTYVGSWIGMCSESLFSSIRVSADAIPTPPISVTIKPTAVVYDRAQTLTSEQKTQARTNSGAAEDPNTSGDPQATLEEPPVVDEEPIP